MYSSIVDVGPDAGAVNPIVNFQNFGGGQSWISMWQSTSFFQGFQDIVTKAGTPPAGGRYVFSNLVGFGGSAILQQNERTDVTPGTYFWAGGTPSASYPGTWADGPLLTSALSFWTSKMGLGPSPDGLVWYQKQQDTLNWDMTTLAAARAEAELWRWGTYYVMIRAGELMIPGNPNGIWRYIDQEGRRNSGFAAQIAVTHDATIDLINMLPTRIRFGMECYDVSLPDNDDHPDHLGAYQMGMRTGCNMANDLVPGSAYPRGPQIGAVTRGAANRIDVPIIVEAGQAIRHPAYIDGARPEGGITSPVGFAFFSGTDWITGTRNKITGAAWVADTLQLTLQNPGQVVMCYPWLDADDLIYLPGGSESSVIRYTTKINAKDIGLPLRTMHSLVIA